MKKGKYIVGAYITGFTFCAGLLVNSFAFPSVLAATTENSKVKTVEAANLEENQKTEQIKDSSNELSQYGIKDGISEKEALLIAINAFKETKDVSNLTYDIKIVQEDIPVDPIKWFVTFYDNNDGYMATINPFSGTIITLEQFSGVKEVFSKDMEKAREEKEKLYNEYYKEIFSIYNNE
ncbi:MULTISPECIES: hypothetical protein [unclassified Niallia]|uniref:hypothetical protein n=2 Tax=Niallia TaxID=2837506 RepID=UPI001EDB1EA1|nr:MULTISPECIES: hypothetical protein [unclassified Niallia]MDL0437537.1 hypothetical protein [Niallia sp. SS-2023]UPO87970.1 hypothetical protein L8T27_001840 [Niallia sp. Man26]